MKGFLQKIKRIPKWGYVFGIFYFGLQYGMYRLGAYLSQVIGTVSYAFECKIPFIDDLIPIIPVFVVIYIYSYFFWICGPIAVSLTGKRNFANYIIGLSLSYLIGFLFFVFVPTFMDRAKEGLMEVARQPGIFNKMLATVYGADGGNLAYNLLPSYHCSISIYCYLGVRKRPEISKWFRIYSLVMAILICMSTVFTKQHYIIDVVLGLAISILCYIFVEKWDPGKKYDK